MKILELIFYGWMAASGLAIIAWGLVVAPLLIIGLAASIWLFISIFQAK